MSELTRAMDALLARINGPPELAAPPAQSKVAAEIAADLGKIAAERAARERAAVESEARRKAALTTPSPPGTTERVARLLADHASKALPPAAPVSTTPAPTAGASPSPPVRASVSPARRGLAAIFAAAIGREPSGDAEAEAAFARARAARDAAAAPRAVVMGGNDTSSLLAAHVASYQTSEGHSEKIEL